MTKAATTSQNRMKRRIAGLLNMAAAYLLRPAAPSDRHDEFRTITSVVNMS